MNTYNPLVSIVIPVYNGANYMREAIDSALSQTYENIEIIVVNDGSTDDGETEKVALSYGDKIKYYKKENGGCASALNYGISKMQGEWFSWLSHDDVYYPEKVESAIECIKANGFTDEKTIVVCSSDVINAKGETVPRIKRPVKMGFYTSNEMFNRLMTGSALNGCALLIPKSMIDKVGNFSTEYIYILDWIYWIELTVLGYNFFTYDDILVKNRRHDAQVSVKKRNRLDEETEEYIMQLVDRVSNDEKKLQNIWLYCNQINFKEGCSKIEGKISLPFMVKIKKLRSLMLHYLYILLKKFASIIKR